jgi:hypothetical protein
MAKTPLYKKNHKKIVFTLHVFLFDLITSLLKS